MITAKEIKSLQTRAPFQPFTIHMSDGRSVEIKHPELMIVYRNFIVVAHSKGDELPDRSERLSILHVTCVEADGVEVV